MGVPYYMTFTEAARSAADAHPDLEEIASSGPWHVYEVAGVDMVSPLANEPAVLDPAPDREEWLDATTAWYQDPARWDVFLAAEGPDDWQRVSSSDTPEARPVDQVEVSNVDVGRDSISFDVDEPGTPVLVRMSYFPNWKVDGAEGPYRVSPNLMVVVPTDTHVELRYGWTPVDILAYVLTLIGIVGVVWLSRQPAIDVQRRRRQQEEPAVESPLPPPPEI
jgi:hypothetical protein